MEAEASRPQLKCAVGGGEVVGWEGWGGSVPRWRRQWQGAAKENLCT